MEIVLRGPTVTLCTLNQRKVCTQETVQGIQNILSYIITGMIIGI